MSANGVTTAVATRAPRMGPVVGLFYAVTMVTAGLIGLGQPLLGVDPVIIELVQFAPTLGVVAVLLVWRRGQWPLATGSGDGLARPLLTVAALCAGIFGAVVVAYAIRGEDVSYTHPGALTHSFALIAVAQFVGACGEEFGWRWFLTPYLRTRHGVLATGTIVGLLWGAWHVQVFAVGPAYTIAFLISTVAMSIILTILLEGAGNHRLLVAGGFHTVVNLGLLLLMGEESGDPVAMTTFAGACLLAALVMATRLRGLRAPKETAR